MGKRLIDEERLSKALIFLASTDESIAQLKAQVSRREYAVRLAKARIFLMSDGPNVEARKADAEKSKDVQDAEGFLADSIEEFEKLKARRATEELIVDVWRSIEASRRQGQI